MDTNYSNYSNPSNPDNNDIISESETKVNPEDVKRQKFGAALRKYEDAYRHRDTDAGTFGDALQTKKDDVRLVIECECKD